MPKEGTFLVSFGNNIRVLVERPWLDLYCLGHGMALENPDITPGNAQAVHRVLDALEACLLLSMACPGCFFFFFFWGGGGCE